MSAAATPIRIIEPRHPGLRYRLREVWTYRRLIPFFAKQYIRKRYVNTYLGWWWLPLRPVLEVGSRVILFGALLQVPSEGVPYLLFLLVGQATWQLFAGGLYWATRSTELNKKFLSRIYVPRLILLLPSIAVELLELGIYLVIIALVFAYYGVADGELYLRLEPELLLALAGLAMVAALALAFGLFTSVYGAQSRDMRFTLARTIGFWMFVTPVLYPVSIVPEQYQTLIALNPVTAPVEIVKWAVLGVGEVQPLAVAVSLATIAIVSVAGMRFFFSSEAAAVDNL